MKSGAEGAHFFGALLLTFSFDKHIARYPFDTDRNPHFYVCTMENVVVDVENLLNRYSEIMNCLEDLYYMYDAKLQAKYEILDN